MVEITRGGKNPLILENPVMAAAGTVGFDGAAYRDLLDFSKLGALVTNPVTWQARRVARGTRVVPLPAGVLVHTGLPNPGIRRVIARYRDRWSATRHDRQDHPRWIRRLVIDGLDGRGEGSGFRRRHARLRVPVEAREVAGGDLDPDAVPSAEQVAGGADVDGVLVDASRLDQPAGAGALSIPRPKDAVRQIAGVPGGVHVDELGGEVGVRGGAARVQDDADRAGDLDVLAERFAPAKQLKAIGSALEAIDDPTVLRSLLRQSAKATSLDEFAKLAESLAGH